MGKIKERLGCKIRKIILKINAHSEYFFEIIDSYHLTIILFNDIIIITFAARHKLIFLRVVSRSGGTGSDELLCVHNLF